MPSAISLCSGIGGLDLAFEMAGIHVTHMIEWNAFCCDVLRARFPDSTVIHGSIEDERNLPYADVVFGGIPCQPYSSAGKQDGFADERNLWPAAYRIIQQVRPRAVLIENVRGSVTGDDNLADYVLSDLESIGYTGAPFLVPACLFGAPHERYRVFIVAYALHSRGKSAEIHHRNNASAPQRRQANPFITNGQRLQIVAYANGQRKQKPRQPTRPVGGQTYSTRQNSRFINAGCRKPQPGMGRAAHGPAHRLDFPGFPAGQGTFQYPYEPPRTVETKVPHHKERVQALGNAVVWMQAYPLAQAIHDWLVNHAV